MDDGYRVEPGKTVSLEALDSADTGSYAGKEQAAEDLARDVERIADLQARLARSPAADDATGGRPRYRRSPPWTASGSSAP